MAERKNDDRLLDEYLRGDSLLSRVYRETGREEPPAHLDAAILAQAKAAATARRSKPRWFMPLSLAATVVLSIGVVLFMSREGVTPVPMETPLPTPGAPVLKPTTPTAPAVIEKAPAVIPKATVAPKEAPVVTPKEVPRFEPRVFTPKEVPAAKTPEQWLVEIEALRKAGKHAEADAELAKFRQRYPDYPLGKQPK
ncbi:MAG: hypothetical protein HY083_02345 [Gammaproteobacteria bacterium]|nr:hypothetical protein [Gammaproteobacteria bacterium]